MFEMKKEFETVEKNDSAYSATETDNGFDNLIASYNDLENLIKFESALIKEDNPEIIKYIIKENNAEYLLDEEVTLENAVVGKSGILNKIAALKDRIVSNVEENSTVILDIIKNRVGDNVNSLLDLKEKIKNAPYDTNAKLITVKEADINNYLGMFTAMNLDIRNSKDVISFINMPKDLMMPIYKENLQYLNFINKWGNSIKDSDDLMKLGRMPKGDISKKFINSLKGNVNIKEGEYFYSFPIKLTSINCSFCYVAKFLGAEEIDIGAGNSKVHKQFVTPIDKKTALAVIDAAIIAISENRKINHWISDTLGVGFADLILNSSSRLASFNPIDPVLLSLFKNYVGFFSVFTGTGRFVSHYLTGLKNLAKSNHDMKNFVKSYIKYAYGV